MCSNGARLLRKIHGFVRFAIILDANSAVLLKKTIGFVDLAIYVFKWC